MLVLVVVLLLLRTTQRMLAHAAATAARTLHRLLAAMGLGRCRKTFQGAVRSLAAILRSERRQGRALLLDDAVSCLAGQIYVSCGGQGVEITHMSHYCGWVHDGRKARLGNRQRPPCRAWIRH